MKSLIKIDILSNIFKIRYDYMDKYIAFLQLGIVIVQTILMCLGLVLSLITRENKILLYLATIPNLILGLLLYLFSKFYAKNNRELKEINIKIQKELDLLCELNNNSMIDNKDIYEAFRTISGISSIPPYDIAFKLDNENEI